MEVEPIFKSNEYDKRPYKYARMHLSKRNIMFSIDYRNIFCGSTCPSGFPSSMGDKKNKIQKSLCISILSVLAFVLCLLQADAYVSAAANPSEGNGLCTESSGNLEAMKIRAEQGAIKKTPRISRKKTKAQKNLDSSDSTDSESKETILAENKQKRKMRERDALLEFKIEEPKEIAENNVDLCLDPPKEPDYRYPCREKLLQDFEVRKEMLDGLEECMAAAKEKFNAQNKELLRLNKEMYKKKGIYDGSIEILESVYLEASIEMSKHNDNVDRIQEAIELVSDFSRKLTSTTKKLPKEHEDLVNKIEQLPLHIYVPCKDSENSEGISPESQNNLMLAYPTVESIDETPEAYMEYIIKIATETEQKELSLVDYLQDIKSIIESIYSVEIIKTANIRSQKKTINRGIELKRKIRVLENGVKILKSLSKKHRALIYLASDSMSIAKDISAVYEEYNEKSKSIEVNDSYLNQAARILEKYLECE
ncbi:uncharacterized protein NESG_00497 [Nematocida ausubeli]|uniref:Uncharacterized protein n=1 Tax=Nematocida ausubeli (strain ATCC PRA-371 / ERTm2) TaxID=1913371 RepID=A0A086J5K0_NEMA1|nr:uncharacterized protein NESG_00497 [Nematocida ausubeli]KFG27418.1 hypothetical protein NESG_00497 [Nematocida ausubeli]